MLRVFTLVLFLPSVTLPSEVTSYAKVSRNGQLAGSSLDSPSWTTRTLLTGNGTSAENESRSINDVVITGSPVYVPPRAPKLKKGEAIDHPTGIRYSTLDQEMIAKLNASRTRIQQRFNPPAAGLFSKDSYTIDRPKKGAIMDPESSPSINSSSFPGPIFPGVYEYNPTFIDVEPPMSKPQMSNKYPPVNVKIPDSYQLSKYPTNDGHETSYPSFETGSPDENDQPESTMSFENHHDHPPPFMEEPYDHHDVIYDHVPVYHEHHPKPTTTEEPEMNDQRLDKRPYSYYFIGKKLWYIPLYFSIYFIIYIAALVLKSVARHKINFPAQLAEAVNHRGRRELTEGWFSDLAERMLGGIERFEMSQVL
ncbi:hypothetical protein PUN28_009719 [Cardiocondyla obscurior]|uniref:Uncharacterized protein n=2 Tax=Cardiocondyla obscurior TaxID=286306 RepID=A0AAW2FWZ5_9HYME